MLKQMIVQRLEINSKEKDGLRNSQVAFLVDKKCFVYKDNDGKLWYFEPNPKLAEALEKVWVNE